MKDLIIDCFAGGGGASVGIEMALGRPVDIAINHDPEAIRMHKISHMKLPIYECTNQYNEFSEQLYPVNISNVKWVNLICDKYPNGCIQISCHDAQENAYYATRLLKCYVSKKGRYAIWGKHRFYEGYSGALILRGVPYKTVDTIKDAAKPYGTIVE